MTNQFSKKRFWAVPLIYKLIAISLKSSLVFYMFSNNYFFVLNHRFFFYKSFYNITVLNVALRKHLYSVSLLNLNKLISIHTLKILFNGKGYRSYISSRNTLTFSFGYSHLLYIYTLDTQVVQLTKNKLLVYGLNTFLVNQFSFQFYAVKPLNIFTLKGVRFRKQIFRKKIGKLSLYF